MPLPPTARNNNNYIHTNKTAHACGAHTFIIINKVTTVASRLPKHKTMSSSAAAADRRGCDSIIFTYSIIVVRCRSPNLIADVVQNTHVFAVFIVASRAQHCSRTASARFFKRRRDGTPHSLSHTARDANTTRILITQRVRHLKHVLHLHWYFNNIYYLVPIRLRRRLIRFTRQQSVCHPRGRMNVNRW